MHVSHAGGTSERRWNTKPGLSASVLDIARFHESDRRAIGALLKAYESGTLVSPSTVTCYITTLYGIATKCSGKSAGLVAALVDDPVAMRKRLRRSVPTLSTYTTTINSIVALFKHSPISFKGKRGADARTFWLAERKDASAALGAQNKNNVLTDNMRDQGFRLHELDAAIEAARDDVKRGRLSGAHTEPGTENQQLLWLVIARHVPPHRRDYGSMRIVADLKEVRDDENAIVLPRRGVATIVLNAYKTARHHHEFTQLVSDLVTNEIRRSVKELPRTHLFVKRDKTPLGDAYFGFWARKAFEKYLKKPATLNSLRRAWVSWIADPVNKHTVAEREQYAKQMNHSLITQMLHYDKIDK